MTSISEHRLVIREVLENDGKTRVELHLEGDCDTADPDDQASFGYAVAATMFQLYQDGTVARAMEKLFDFKIGNIAVRLVESE